MTLHSHHELLTLAIGMPGGWEWFIILLIGLLLFGKRLPEVGRSLGRGIVEFKKGIKGIGDEIEEESTPKPPPAPPPPSARPYLSEQSQTEAQDFKKKQAAAARSPAESDDDVD